MLTIVFEDAHCLAADKPCGLPTQGPEHGPDTLEALVRRHLGVGVDRPADAYLGTVHRLDRPVSGVVLWAKTPKAARRLAAQFAARTVRKEYWAIVERPTSPVPEVWDDFIGPLDPSGRAHQVGPDDRGARRAFTRVRAVEVAGLAPGRSLLVLRPETGRTHQLRVQASARGMPILGDARYGSALCWPSGIALHARSLAVEHPATRRPIAFEADPPAVWAAEGVEVARVAAISRS